MGSLPFELLLTILEYAYYELPRDRPQLASRGQQDTVVKGPDVRTLKSCSLVSSAWRLPAQQLLFRSVQLGHGDPGHAVESFRHTTDPSTERGRTLGGFVRSIEVLVGEVVASNHSTHDLSRLIGRCPQLYELVIRAVNIHQFDAATMSELTQLATGPNPIHIRALSLLSCGIQSPILFQLLSVWPTVRFLRISMELNATPPTVPSNLHLYELTLLRLPSIDIAGWLLASPETRLHIAEFRDMPGRRWNELLAAHGSRLRSLRLMPYIAGVPSLLRKCPNLEEAIFYTIPPFLQLDALPVTLEHLGFRNPLWSSSPSLQPVLQAIDNLPRLRIVTCDPSTLEHPDFESLKEKCERRRVELRTDALPMMAREDPVPVCRFPRRKSVSNFALMN